MKGTSHPTTRNAFISKEQSGVIYNSNVLLAVEMIEFGYGVFFECSVSHG